MFLSAMKWMNVESMEVQYGNENEPWDGYDDTIKINGVNFWDFMKKQKLSKNDILMDHVVLITRIFDNRLKSFFKNIVMKSDPNTIEPAFKYYSYRIEFQARGLPHCHAVLWIGKEWLENFGLNLDLLEGIDTKEIEEKLIELIDTLISCRIPKEDETESKEDKMRREFVLKLQQHDHTATCKKKNTECRFDFPKFPSERTIIAKPIEGNDEEKAKKLKEYAEILENAKTVLRNMPTAKELRKMSREEQEKYDMSFEEFYQKIGVKKEKYEEALGSTTKGYMVILRREVRDRWTNNYHPLWILIWNANMDIQIGKKNWN